MVLSFYFSKHDRRSQPAKRQILGGILVHTHSQICMAAVDTHRHVGNHIHTILTLPVYILTRALIHQIQIYRDSSKSKKRSTVSSTNFTAGHVPKADEILIPKYTSMSTFIAALFMVDKIWNQPRCPLKMNGQIKCGIFPLWNTTQQ